MRGELSLRVQLTVLLMVCAVAFAAVMWVLLPAGGPVTLNVRPGAAVQGTDAPECRLAPITSESRRWWVKWCGTGPDGEPPLRLAVAGLTDDGGNLSFTGCGTRRNPCVILWPGSPAS